MKNLLEQLKQSKLYSEELGIDLNKNNDPELFKWFLASILFGARISETIAKNTYKTFEKYNLLAPEKIIDVGWEFLAYPIMREGGYVRYDGRKSTQVLRDCEELIRDYDGSLNKLHNQVKSSGDLEDKLRSFYGVGPITVNIFLRELRPFWDKSDPQVLPVVEQLARTYGIDLNAYDRKSITFVRIEAGLIKLRKKRPKH